MPEIDDVSPAQLPWTGVSPKYTSVCLVKTAIGGLVWLVVSMVPLALALLGIWGDRPQPWMWVPPAVVLVWTVIDLLLIPRRVRALGYAEDRMELWLRRGLLFRTITVVPYGRMQYVDITTGPLLNAYGLANLTLHTAASETKASLPGLPHGEADRLREQLTRRGEELMAGL